MATTGHDRSAYIFLGPLPTLNTCAALRGLGDEGTPTVPSPTLDNHVNPLLPPAVSFVHSPLNKHKSATNKILSEKNLRTPNY